MSLALIYGTYRAPKSGEEEENRGNKDNQTTLMEKKGEAIGNRENTSKDEPLLMALNHVSRLSRSVKDSVDFYTKVLGFVLVERPLALDFDGAWLFNYGVGIHLVQSPDDERLPRPDHELDPMDNHISFQVHIQLLYL